MGSDSFYKNIDKNSLNASTSLLPHPSSLSSEEDNRMEDDVTADLSLDNLTLDPESKYSERTRHYDKFSRRNRALSSANSPIKPTQRVDSPGSQASSGRTARTQVTSSSSLSNWADRSMRPQSLMSKPDSPMLSENHTLASGHTEFRNSSLARYRHDRKSSQAAMEEGEARSDSATSFSRRNTISVASSRPLSRQLPLRTRTLARESASGYSSRVPTQILIKNLMSQIDKELESYETLSDKWSQFKIIQEIQDELVSAQADSYFPPDSLDLIQFRRRFDRMIMWLESAHASRLQNDLAEKERRQQLGEEPGPFDHLSGDLRRLAVNGAAPFLLPPYTYPQEIPILHVEPIHNTSRGFGVQLLEDIGFNSPLFQIPNHLILASSSAQFNSKVAEIMTGREVFFQYNALIRLTLLLIVEMLEGFQSPFYAYLSTLPPCPWSPLYYPVSMLEPYRKAMCVAEIIDHTRNVTQIYHTIYKHLTLSTFLNRKNFTWEAFRWAYSTVLSRAVPLPLPTPSLLGSSQGQGGVQEFGLVPLLDLANYSHDAAAPLYNPANACLELFASGPMNAGSEIFVRWPFNNNRELLLRHGICADRMLSYDSLKLHLSLTSMNRDEESWNRYVFCQSIRLPTSSTFLLNRPPAIKTSRELLQYVLVFALDLNSLKKLVASAPLNSVPGRDYLRDRNRSLRLLDAALGEVSEGNPPTPAFKTALNWLRVFLQVHLRVSLRFNDLDNSIRTLDPENPSSYPLRWVLLSIRHEQRFTRAAIDEFDSLLGGKSILDDQL